LKSFDSIPKGALGVDIDPVRRRAYVVGYWGPPVLAVYDADTLDTLWTTTLPNVNPTALTFNPSTHRFYVAHQFDGKVDVFNQPPLQGGVSVNTDANGNATFSGISVSDVGTGYALLARVEAVNSSQSSAFDVDTPPVAVNDAVT